MVKLSRLQIIVISPGFGPKQSLTL